MVIEELMGKALEVEDQGARQIPEAAGQALSPAPIAHIEMLLRDMGVRLKCRNTG